MGNPLRNEAVVTGEAALAKQPALVGADALSRGRQAAGGSGPPAALSEAEWLRIVCEKNTHEVMARRVAMLLAAPGAKGLALFVSAFQRSFGYDDPGRLAVRVMCALPNDQRGWQEFDLGYNEGCLLGLKQGFDEIVDMLAWLRDAAFSFIAIGFDEEFGEQLGKALFNDVMNGVSPLDGRAAKLLEDRYPVLHDIARLCAFFLKLEDLLRKFVLSVAENGFMEVLSAAGVKVAAALGQALGGFVEEFVGLSNDRKAQGRMIGVLYGRIVFEIAAEVATLPVKPASAPARATRGARAAATAAANIVESVPKVREDFRRLLSIEKTVALGHTLEKVLAEAYMNLRGLNKSYRDLRRLTEEFNEAYQQLARKSGWLDRGDLLIRLDAHHIIEERAFDKLKSKAGFKEAFEKLKWSSRDDMPSVALETEFHIRSPDRLNVQFLMNDLSLKDVKSLTNQLKDFIGDPESYETFLELLNKYESFYRRQNKIIRDGREITIPILWPMVEQTFTNIRATLKLPPAPG